MLKTVTTLVTKQRDEIERLRKELKDVKQKLQHRHTEINDLRFAKRELQKVLQSDMYSK